MIDRQLMASNLAGPAIVFLGDGRAGRADLTGAKTAHLSRFAARYPVPHGFCLTADATDISLHEPGLRAGLIEAWERLVAWNGSSVLSVAVRSSAVDEDGPTASFAGQHDTFLNVTGFDAVLDAIERCRASAWSEQVRAYRQQHGLSVERVRIAVLVQQMVRADASGVAFSANPINGRRDEIVVTASYGLGESVVGGTVTPDSWVLDATTIDVSSARIGDKRRMTVAIPGGTREVDVPRMLRQLPSLTAEQVGIVGELVRALEADTGWPVDIEFAFAGGQLYLLQCRPITTLGGLGTFGSPSDVAETWRVAS
jgi:pyruvate,water dikinase